MLAGIRTRDLLTAAGTAIAVALVLRLFVLGVFSIPSHSMERTLRVGDHVLVSKLAYLVAPPARGDVVVFTLPDSLRGSSTDEAYIKRVIGVGGDTVLLNRFGITINGVLQPAPPQSASMSPLPYGERRVIVPPGHVFVLGDHRSNSWDSRYWGFLPLDHVVGRAVAIAWSTNGAALHWDRILRRID